MIRTVVRATIVPDPAPTSLGWRYCLEYRDAPALTRTARSSVEAAQHAHLDSHSTVPASIDEWDDAPIGYQWQP